MALVAAVYLGQTTYVAGQMQEMEDLERRLRETRWANNDLLLEIAQHQHMSRIEEEATALGLGPAEQFQYVEVLVGELNSPPRARTARTWSDNVPLFRHLPDWLQEMWGQFLAWTAGPVVRAEQVPE
jgi:hypothetical protein